MENKKLPVGIENFAEIRREDFYYIDKTGLIRDLLRDWGEGEPLHPPAPLWQDPQHEHAQMLL